MTVEGLFDKTLAIAKRDWLTAVRYRTGFLITMLGAAAELAAFYYLARAIGPAFHPDGIDYFPFLLVGTGFYTFLVTGVNAFLVIIQEAQQTGTLEVLVTTSTPAPVLLFLSALSAFAGGTLQLIFYIGAGLLLADFHFHPNLAASLVIFVVSLIIAVAFGMFAASLQLTIQKGSALVWLLGSGAWFMTGTLFPVSTLPQPLWRLAQWIPITHALTAMRMALLQGANLAALGREIAVLVLFCVVLLPLGLWVFSRTLRAARRAGTLSFY